MKAYARCSFLVAVLTLATAAPGMRISAAADPEVKRGAATSTLLTAATAVAATGRVGHLERMSESP